MNESETAVVNEPSMFEPLKFYCTWLAYIMLSNDTNKVHTAEQCHSYQIALTRG